MDAANIRREISGLPANLRGRPFESMGKEDLVESIRFLRKIGHMRNPAVPELTDDEAEAMMHQDKGLLLYTAKMATQHLWGLET